MDRFQKKLSFSTLKLHNPYLITIWIFPTIHYSSLDITIRYSVFVFWLQFSNMTPTCAKSNRVSHQIPEFGCCVWCAMCYVLWHKNEGAPSKNFRQYLWSLQPPLMWCHLFYPISPGGILSTMHYCAKLCKMAFLQNYTIVNFFCKIMHRNLRKLFQ